MSILPVVDLSLSLLGLVSSVYLYFRKPMVVETHVHHHTETIVKEKLAKGHPECVQCHRTVARTAPDGVCLNCKR